MGSPPVVYFYTMVKGVGNITSWNTKGLNNESKRKVVSICLKENKSDIACLQETHAVNDRWTRSLGFSSGLWSNGNSNSRGICILWKSKVTKLKQNRTVTSGKENSNTRYIKWDPLQL